ncbi:MAG: PAS domain-containing protein [Sphingobacteriales bacterium]|nr:PAS domain-containing protein [Sphingobacteriales bacterium]
MKNGTYSTFSFSASEERINKLINGLRIGILLKGPKSEILFSNKAALEMLGLTEEGLHEKSFCNTKWDVIHEDGSPFPEDQYPFRKAIETKRTVRNVIMGIYRPSLKDRVWMQVNAEPLIDEEGEVKEVICSFSDITERKAVEEKLTSLYQSLESRALELATSNNDLQRFVHFATHDLQEPLRMVSSFTQLLKKKYEAQLDDQAIEYINYAVDGATRMKKLILDLLEYSKFSSNREVFTQTDMNKVIKDACKNLHEEITDNKVELDVPVLPVVRGKSLLITQLVENLIGNAIKYRSERKPLIKIRCDENEDHYLFSFSDNGIGIDKKYSDKIFILFQRLHSGSENNESTGVGLAICKKIVELHNGTIWVESEEGKGSNFYFTIAKN